MLYLIGLGLDKKDVSLKALEIIKGCDKVYLENYTNVFSHPVKEIEKLIGKKVIFADRKTVEEKKDIIEESKKKKVALLISGDPLAATTHADLFMRARKEKVKVEVIHSTSVFNAIAETGLQLYKFGKTASIAKWVLPSFRPESFYEVVKENLGIGAHTLLLLDIGLSANEALSYLESMAKMKDSQINDWDLVVCENLGTSKQKISYGKIGQLVSKKYSLPACMVVLGKMHFMEKEMLDEVSKR